MVCRHAPGDPAHGQAAREDAAYARSQLESETERLRGDIANLAAELAAEKSGKTPDNANYEIQRVERVGPHLVMEVLYPNCKKCSYEGRKVMVFLNVTEVQVLKWRKMDPHFSDKVRGPTEAPSPAARFPASDQGWKDAVAYAVQRGPAVTYGRGGGMICGEGDGGR